MAPANPAWLLVLGAASLALGLVLVVAGIAMFLSGQRGQAPLWSTLFGTALVVAGFSMLRFGAFALGGPKKKADPAPPRPPEPASPPGATRGPSAAKERLVVCPGCGYQERASRGTCELCGTKLEP